MRFSLILLLIAASAFGSEFPPAGKQRIPGFSATTGTVSSSDTIERALSKLAGNAAAAATATHAVYTDATIGSDSTGNGSATKPYRTIQAALTSIGSAANSTEFNTDATAYWTVNAAPGVYTEDLSIPTRQYIKLNFSGVKLIGNVTWALNGANTGTVAKAKLVISGDDVRSMYTGASYPLTGITGNLTISNAATNQVVVDLSKVGIGGNILWKATPAAFSGQMFISEGIVVGDISAELGTQPALYVVNTDTSSSKAIGSVGQLASGAMLLNVLRGVRFVGPVTVSTGTLSGGRWRDVSFATSVSNNLTGHTISVDADANSLNSFYAKFSASNRGTFTPTYADDVIGIGYTPTVSGNWSSAPATAQAALDTAATMIAGKEPTISAGTSSQYWRGDKTWATLDTSAVAEGSNLYLTNARVIGAPITGFTSGAGSLAATDTVLQAIQKLDGNVAGKEPALGNPSVSGYVLSSTTGGVRSWVDQSSGSGSPGGSTTQVQYNNASAFGGAAQMKWDNVNNRLTLGDGTTGGISAPAVLESWTSGNRYHVLKNATVESIWGVDSSGFIGNYSDHDFMLRVNNTNRIQLYSGGNAGRGDFTLSDFRVISNGTVQFGATPSIKFDSTNGYLSIGSTTLDRPLRIGGGTASSITGSALEINFADTSQHAMVFKNTNVTGYHLIDSANYIFGSLTSTPVTIRTNNTDRMTWDAANGNATLTTTPVASTPGMWLKATPFTGGTATTTKPTLLIEPASTTSTGWSTSGTSLGVNGPTGFAGNLADFQVSGTSKASISSAGTMILAGNVAPAGASIGGNGINSASNNSVLILGNARSFTLANKTQVQVAAQTDSSTSGTAIAVQIAPTYNQSASSTANTDLQIARTETSVGSGVQKLIEAKVGATVKSALFTNGTLSLTVQGSGTTPTCDSSHDGALGLTSAYILCVCKGGATSWVKTSDGSTACTF